MRHNQNRRSRGRSRKSPNPLTRSYESNGPEGVKVRGAPAHIAERYMTLARDAQSAGDTVAAENYLQHAEHYNRIVMAAQAQFQQFAPSRDAFDEEDEGEGGEFDRDDFRPERRNGPEMRPDMRRERGPEMRGDRPDRPADRQDRYDRQERPERAERFDRPERGGFERDDGPRRPPRREEDEANGHAPPERAPYRAAREEEAPRGPAPREQGYSDEEAPERPRARRSARNGAEPPAGAEQAEAFAAAPAQDTAEEKPKTRRPRRTRKATVEAADNGGEADGNQLSDGEAALIAFPD